MNNKEIGAAMTIKLDPVLPEYPVFKEGIRRAPMRELTLNEREIKLAVKNALRYVPEELHKDLAPEFMEELLTRGRIYGYRFMPKERIYGKPIDEYKGNCVQGKAFQVMIDNNLNHDVALYPYELVTYGETGQVCQNWMQYQLIKKYLEILTDEQTLVVMSGHPLGLFKSHKSSPRVVITNGLMVGEGDNPEAWAKATAMGCSSYGQMTAGGWMYIGPQGIVHGTFNTILNAGRKFLGVPHDGDLAGHLFVTSGLGGMSGAQNEIKRAVEAGYWHMYRFNPTLKEEGKNPFTLDSKEPTASFRDFLLSEVRYSALQRTFPEVAEELFEQSEKNAKERLENYKRLANQ